MGLVVKRGIDSLLALSHPSRGNGARGELGRQCAVCRWWRGPTQWNVWRISLLTLSRRSTECSGRLFSNNSPLRVFSTKGRGEQRDRALSSSLIMWATILSTLLMEALVLQGRGYRWFCPVCWSNFKVLLLVVGVRLGGINRVSCLHSSRG